MNIHLAKHHGMCFGVRDALRSTHDIARQTPVTILGQLVHNPLVDEHLRTLGVKHGTTEHTGEITTRAVVITAHGTSDARRSSLTHAGFHVTDTTCPLVRKAHDALAALVREGYFPVVIGQASHVEVRGLVGDFPEAIIILDEADITRVPARPRFGVISQTTQPLVRVLNLVDGLKRAHPTSELRFVDTVCHPTKQRQTALAELSTKCDTIVVVGGRNSNNTRQLAASAAQVGALVFQIERADELQAVWFRRSENVGVTAGTSTLDETVREVMDRLQQIASDAKARSLWAALFSK